MRSNRDDTRPAVPAEWNEQVMCALHRSRRLAKFCVCKPVYNADRVVIDYTYECNDNSQCKNRDGKTREVPTTPSSATVTVAADAEVTEAAPVKVRALNRYYDLANQRGGSGVVKKVCWHCGMEGHEKPECPNVLCRVCHTTREHHHTCQEPSLSPFIVLSPSLPLLTDMTNVRCVSCFEMGHMDCSEPTSVMSTISCCYCGEVGHSAYECRRRQEMTPDLWLTRIQKREWAEGHGVTFNNHAYTNVKNSFSSYTNKHGNPSSPLYKGESQSPRANFSGSWDRRTSRQHWESNGHVHHHTESSRTDHHKGHYSRGRHGEHYTDNRGGYNQDRRRDYQRNSPQDYQSDNRRDYHKDNSRDYHVGGQRSYKEHRHMGFGQEDRDRHGYSRGREGARRQREDAVDSSRDQRRFRHESPQPYKNDTGRDAQGYQSQTQVRRRRRPPYQSDDDFDDIF